jgi:hypothetical protein
MRSFFALLGILFALAGTARAQEDEIVANLAGGRVIIHVTRDAILFAAIDHPLEASSVPPRVADIDSGHVAVFFGASEWQSPAAPKSVRLDRDIEHLAPTNERYQVAGAPDVDLEQIGVIFLEKLRPLVAQLHHAIDLKPDDPLFQIILIGYAPKGYGPEVWQIDYRLEQNQPGAQADFLQTHILRPRFTQLYPPEKHDPRTLLEIRFPAELQEIPLLGLIQQNDPRIAQLRSSDPKFAKVIDLIEHGQANKAVTPDAESFLRAALPLIAGNAHFFQATFGEDSGFHWVVPPEEPTDRDQQAKDKNRPPDAPTLRRKPNP